MNLITIEDCNDGEIYGIVLSQTSTEDDIQEIIYEIKNEINDYSTGDLINRLPYDCAYYSLNKDTRSAYI